MGAAMMRVPRCDWNILCLEAAIAGLRSISTKFFLILCVAQFLSSQSEAESFNASVPVAKVVPEVVSIPMVLGNDIRFRRLSSSQGLSQTRVAQIVQDDQGFMWFGTQHGVNRFDGYEYRVFKNDPDQPDSLSGIFIYALFKDRGGTIWVGSDQGLDAFDRVTETFKHFPVAEPNPVIIHISEDPDGYLWLATSEGLYRLDPRTGERSHFTHDANLEASLASDDIKSTGFDRTGTFWVVTGQGLDAFDRGTGRVTSRIPLRDAVREFSFHEDRFGTFWIVHGSGNGIATFDRKKNELTHHSFSADKSASSSLTGVYAILETRDGTLWLATMGAGLLKYDRENKRFISYQRNEGDPESIAENRVIALYEDAEGNVWTGLHATPPNSIPSKEPPFESLKPLQPFTNTSGESLVNAIFSDSTGRVWLGAGGALTSIDRTTNERHAVDPLARGEPIEILTIREGPDKSIWVGSLGSGLFQLDRTGQTLRAFRHDPSDRSSLSSDIVTRLHFDQFGTMWASTWNGLVRYDATSGTFATFKSDPLASAESYFSITEQRDGLFWLGSTTGLHSFDPRTLTFKRYTNRRGDATSLSNNTVNTVHVDEAGLVWIGTQHGLNRLDTVTGVFKRFFQKDGLAGGSVSCILEDKQGYLWMSTNRGVSRMSRGSQEFRNYSTADGLPGNDLTGWNACYSSDEGELFFGGFSGATAILPDMITENRNTPPVVLTALNVAEKRDRPSEFSTQRSISLTEAVTLAPEQNDFSIQFAALSFSNPETNRYRYRMLGMNDSWHDAGNNRSEVRYALLPHGKYRFEVQAATSRGAWSQPGAGIDITVLPPWWDTVWFRGIYISAAVLGGLLLYHFRLRRVAHQYNIRSEERIMERTRIARELHDSLLQGFHGLLFSLQAVRNLLPHQPEKAMVQLDTALERGDQAIVESRNAVQDLRDPGPADVDLAQALASLGNELEQSSTQPSPKLRVFVEGRRRGINPLVRDEVYRVGREAIRNAFKHSKGTLVECELNYSDKNFRMRIRDDGEGMDEEILRNQTRTGHWGLPGMRERVEKLGGTLEVWSAAGKGTELELRIPGAMVYG